MTAGAIRYVWAFICEDKDIALMLEEARLPFPEIFRDQNYLH